MNNFKSKFFVDPVLNEIDFSNENNWMVQLINTPEFKRLNRIHQLGVTYIIFPTATHNRLSHSLGAFEIVRRFIKHLHLDKLEPRESQHLLCAALLHDLGHGPNSHAFERYTGTNHEEYTKKFILDKSTNINKILLKHGINPKEVVDILNQKTNKLWATALIDSQIDGDRMDYLLRDSKYTGASYGVISPTYIINGSVLINNRICFSMKTLTEIENLLLGRFHMYKQIYSNPNSVKYEFVIQQIFLRIKYLYKTGHKFTNKYNLIQVFKPFLDDREYTVEEFLKLDDYIFSTFIESLKGEKDSIIQKLLSAYYDESLIEVKKVDKVDKTKKSNFLEGFYITKPIDIYHTGRGDEIYIYDEIKNKVFELSKVSDIVQKMMNIKYKIIYKIKIK